MKCQEVGMALAAMAVVGCATTGSMRSAPLSEGKSQVFAAPFDKVLDIARDAIAEAGFSIEEVNEIDETATSYIAEKSGGAFSYGERVRVLVQLQSDTETLVRVLTKKKLATNVFAKGDWADTLFDLIATNLGSGR